MALPGPGCSNTMPITMPMPMPMPSPSRSSATAAPVDVIADIVSPDQLNASYIVPRVFDERVAPAVARAAVVAPRHGVHAGGGAKESALL